MGDDNLIRTLGDYSKLSHEGYRNTIELPVGNNVVPLRSDTIRLVQNGCSFHRLRSEDPNQHLDNFLKLVDSLDLEEDLALYDNKTWNDPRDFAKSVKAINLPQDVPSTSDRRLIKLENQVQRLMEAYLASTHLTQVNKITASCKICNGPYDTHNCMKGPEQACVDCASSYANEIRGKREEAISLKNPTRTTAGRHDWKNTGNSIAPKSIAAISHDEKEELRKKGVKSPSKLLSLKYLSPASIKELNKNPSSPKCVHFVNSIVILSMRSQPRWYGKRKRRGKGERK
ncbi:hypothetical protein Tco_0412875 [Tanacetum coccineum]